MYKYHKDLLLNKTVVVMSHDIATTILNSVPEVTSGSMHVTPDLVR